MTRNLVIDGKEIQYPTLTSAHFDGDRFALPARFTEFVQFSGKSAIDCWLLVITPGRYRLLVEPLKTPEGPSRFLGVLERWEEYAAPGDVLSGTENNERAGILARLIPTTVAPMGTNWRVTIPKEAMMLIPISEDKSFVFVMMVSGFVEIWFPDTLRQAVSIPIDKILS